MNWKKMCGVFSAAVLTFALLVPAGGLRAAEQKAGADGARYHVLQGSRLTLEERFLELKKQGTMEGDGSGSNLEGTTNRAQLAKVLAKLLELPEAPQAASVFGDLEDHAWARGYIGAAAQAGLMGGTAADRFAPGAPVTLEQLAAVFARAFGLKPAGGEDAIAQYSKVSGWAAVELDAAYAAGLIGTTGDYTVVAKRSDLVASVYAAHARKENFLGRSCGRVLSAEPYDRCQVSVGDKVGGMTVTEIDYWADNDEIFGYKIRFQAPQPVQVSGTYRIVPGEDELPEHVVFQAAAGDAGRIPVPVLKWGSPDIVDKFKSYDTTADQGGVTIAVSDYEDLLFPKGGIPDSTQSVELAAAPPAS
ncbi:S-layer homology domain-containing protein [Paenibacillus sp. S-38]|uniref:S-layer homology domain-containing protein n=1 Tax=Paenibacillus sp. S-38 TaxID=3416710 RepID=UPI003CF87CB5